MADPALTERQRRFVAEYLIDLNASAAYRRAGYNVKSEAVSRANAARLLTKANVTAAIRDARREREKRTEVTQDEVIAGLWKEAHEAGEGSTHGARVRAWELLGKHHGMFVDKLAPTTPDGKQPYDGVFGGELARQILGNPEAAAHARNLLESLGGRGPLPAALRGGDGPEPPVGAAAPLGPE